MYGPVCYDNTLNFPENNHSIKRDEERKYIFLIL